jgi:hypothetical protein
MNGRPNAQALAARRCLWRRVGWMPGLDGWQISTEITINAAQYPNVVFG